MSGAVTAVPRAGRQQAARRRTAPIEPHGRMLKRCGSSPVCVSERNLNTETREISPVSGQHLVGALHARSPVTLRKKDRGAYAQVSADLARALAGVAIITLAVQIWAFCRPA